MPEPQENNQPAAVPPLQPQAAANPAESSDPSAAALPHNPSLEENVIILLGPPGSGKGTQAKLISVARGIPHISTGQMLRDAIQSGSDLGQQVKENMDQGKLVPDELVLAVVGERLSQPDCGKGFILDGFPRTVSQAAELDQILCGMGVRSPRIIDISVPEEVVTERIVQRGRDGSGRSDDTAEIAAQRYAQYKIETLPVSGYYAGRSLLNTVDGQGTVEEVQNLIGAVLTSYDKG